MHIWQWAKRFLRIWLPLILILAVVLWLLYRTDVSALQEITRADERHVIQLANQTISTELEMLRGDTFFLAQQTSLHHWLESGDSSAKAQLSTDFLAFARNRGLYDQIRFLDNKGQEVVRVNWNAGRPELVSTDKLQNKSGRYYVDKTLALKKGELYISPFDLNIENHVIEQPIKPMIRLGTPVFDHAGKKRGLIIVNYLGQRLLDQLRNIGSQNDQGVWLLNEKGYWLLGPSPGQEWGFMYPDRQEVRFSQIHDSAWQAIQTDASGKQFLLKNGLFTYMDLQPKAAISGSSGGRWLLVTFVPAETFSANVAKRNNGLISVFILFALLVTIVSIVLAQKDVQRRQGEVRVRESEARFRALLDSAPDAIVIVDENGCITLVNSQTEKCFGYQRNELLGQPIERLVPERSSKRHKTERKEYIACPKARPMVAEPVLMGLRKDGSEFPVEISLSPLQTEHGLLVTSIVRDITARKEAELAKQQVEARYRTLVNNLPVGVYRNTPGNSGCFLEVNPAMVEIFEAKTTQELMAHSVSDLYCNPDDRKTFNDKMLQQGFVSAEEAHLKTLTGREFDAAITAVAKKDVAGQMYFDGIVEDISERKRTERQIQQLNDSLNFRSTELEAINQELEAFSYSVSHDLRTPLRAMDGFSRTLLKDYGNVLDEKGRDRLNRVRAAAQRMSELIDDLLKLSRVTRTEVKWESVDLSSCANNIADELRDGEPEREVEFLIQPDLNTHGDARLLQVVMSNLLGNAWKFTGLRNDAKIEVGAKVNGGGMTYYVRDNGAGFDMSYADKLFGAFQRLHDTNEFSGTGIGLATVQRVINKHGGKIWADSAVDEGATFYFNLGQGGNNERQGDFAG